MKLSEKQFDLIHKYLSDGLNSSEKSDFNKHLGSSDFREELMHQARLIDSLAEADASLVRDSLQDKPHLSVVKDEPTAHRPHRSPHSSRRWLMLAGAFIFLGTAFWLMTQNQETQPKKSNLIQLAETYDTPLPPGQVLRGTDEQPAQSKAMQAYANESYEEALAYFRSNTSQSVLDKIYMSNCLIQLGRFEEAKTTLKGMNFQKNDKLKDDADWYMAIAQLGLEDEVGAKTILSVIAQDSDNIYQANAQKILKKLK